MNKEWKLPEQFESPAEVMARQIKDVLLEHDGPQMVIFADKIGEYLGLAVDTDRDITRWIQVPLSHLEREAILSGAQPVRDAFLKKTVWIIDTHDIESVPLIVWRSNWSAIPSDVLPKRGVTLMPPQMEVRPVREPILHFAGQGAARDGATLPQIAALATTFHQVFVAIAREIIGIADPRPMTVFATQEGSLAMRVHPENPAIFDRMANRYREMVRASDDQGAFDAVVAVTPAAVVEAFQRHLDALDKQRAEMLTEWPSGAVFIGHDVADKALEENSFEPTAPAPLTTATRAYRGFFEGFWRRRPARFDFYDVDSNETFTGTVDKAITARLGQEFALTIGRSQRKYLITALCQINASGEIIGRRLLAFREAEQ